VVVLALAATLAACGSSGGSASPRTTNDSTVATQSARPSPSDRAQAEAIAAYNAMWRDMASAALTADYQSPQPAQHASGDALPVLTRGLYTNQRRGIVVKGQPLTNPSVTSAKPEDKPSTVAISDCFDDTNWLNYIASTGELQNNVPGGRHQTTATVV